MLMEVFLRGPGELKKKMKSAFHNLLRIFIISLLANAYPCQTGASELRSIPIPNTDKGSIIIPEKTFPEGNGVPIPIYVPPIIDNSNVLIKDDWKTVLELNGQEVNKITTGFSLFFFRQPDIEKKLLDIKTDYKILVQMNPPGEFRAIIETSGIDRTLQDITETMNSSKIIKEEENVSHIFNVDRKHGNDPYIAYIYLNQRKIDIVPKIYPKDKLTLRFFKHKKILDSVRADILTGEYEDTEVKGEQLANYLTPVYKTGIDLKLMEKLLSDQSMIACMSIVKKDFQAGDHYNKAVLLLPECMGKNNDLTKCDLAINELTKAIQKDPRYDWAYLNRGDAYKFKGNTTKALEDYNKAISINPKFGSAYYYRAELFFQTKDYDKAIADYTRAIESNYVYARVYFARADTYTKKADWGSAIEDYTQAINLAPEEGMYYFLRGCAYEKVGRNKQAINDYTKAISLGFENAEVYWNRAMLRVEMREGCVQEVIQDLTKVISLKSDFAAAYMIRGIFYNEIGKSNLAENDLKKALTLTPNGPDREKILKLLKEMRPESIRFTQ
jgi:tetratricopeptide (TPR) repeat protein